MIEIYYTLELLAQLTFNEKIKQSINESKKYEKIFFALMEKNPNQLANETDKLVYSGMLKVIEQIQWNLNTENRKSNLNDSYKVISQNQPSNNQRHIMISYNSASRELCVKIKKELESMGHKVWIDIEKISGSSLESMANAVENSFCVLMCVTEKYRQSINCQAEAQYAFRENKPIIPLIMQQGYENPKGWLGFIMGTKIYVNFIKYNFEECIKRLKHEIDSIKRNSKLLESLSEIKSEINSIEIENKFLEVAKSDSIEDWSEEKVKEWFIQNNLSLLIFENFKPCNGKILKQLYETKVAAPEIYFKTFKNIENFEFKNIMPFGVCLDDLFKMK